MTFEEPTYIRDYKPKFLRPRNYKSFHGLDEVCAEVLAEMRADLGRTRRQRRQREQSVVALIASMHQCVIEGRPLGIKMDSGKYKFSAQLHPEWWTYRSINGAVKSLEELEHIIRRPGYLNPETGEGKITKLYASPALLQLFKEYAPIAFETESHQTLVMRNRDKEDVTYTANAYTVEKQRFIDRVNEWLQGFTLELDGRRLGTELVSIHSKENWKLHGRFYNDIQCLPSATRERITIDGEPVVDVDFVSMHPRSCYARRGLEPVHVDGDYYTPVLDHIGVFRCWGDYDLLRKAVKNMFVSMLNACDEFAAFNSFGDRIDRACKGLHSEKKAKTLHIAEALERHNIDGEDLITAIEEVHHAIKDDFTSENTGLQLMFDDSEIMRSILDRCMLLNIPAYPIHDSVLVPQRHESLVKQIMEDIFTAYYIHAPHRMHNSTL